VQQGDFPVPEASVLGWNQRQGAHKRKKKANSLLEEMPFFYLTPLDLTELVGSPRLQLAIASPSLLPSSLPDSEIN
jgi:hypothetical protein